MRYAAGAGCLLAATSLSLAIPWTVKHAIDAIVRGGAAAPLGMYVWTIVALALANGAARLGSRFAVVGGAQGVEADLREDLFRAFAAYSPRTLARFSTGELMARASSDVAQVKSLVGFGAVSLVSTVFAFTGAVVAMLAADPWLTLWSMSPYPVLIALARRFNLLTHSRTQAMQDQLGVVASTVQERIAGIAVVRAYTMERATMAEFSRANEDLRDKSVALAAVQARFTPLMGLVGGVGTLVVLWAGGRAVASGGLSLGGLVAFMGYLAYLAWPTMALGFTLSLVRRGLTSMDRLQELLDAAPASVALASPISGPPAIAFSRLSFAYDSRAPVLCDVSFDVAAGEMVAVVGPTGSGKSTLAAVLARLWEPPPGAVLLAGHDVTTLAPAALRAMLGWVPQEAFLFSRSIEDNIALGRDEVDTAAVRAAAEAAGVAGEIESLPHGYATVVGERGLTVSGGQRQRLALARALVGQPRILVLDDAFASVDVAKEEELLARLREGKRTILAMTHRLRAAQIADRVIVLAGGRVVERGTHADLLERDGLYARLWRIQQLEEEIARA